MFTDLLDLAFKDGKDGLLLLSLGGQLLKPAFGKQLVQFLLKIVATCFRFERPLLLGDGAINFL